jgi:hypothetical protein
MRDSKIAMGKKGCGPENNPAKNKKAWAWSGQGFTSVCLRAPPLVRVSYFKEW